jgi:hypothetical protein
VGGDAEGLPQSIIEELSTIEDGDAPEQSRKPPSEVRLRMPMQAATTVNFIRDDSRPNSRGAAPTGVTLPAGFFFLGCPVRTQAAR